MAADEGPAVGRPPRRAQRVDLIEATHPEHWDWLLARFTLMIDWADEDGPDGPAWETRYDLPDDHADDETWDDDEPDRDDDASDEDEDWDDEDEGWLLIDERLPSEDPAPPGLGLPLDQAVAEARALSDHVTVYLDHDPWDASATARPGAARTWPPAELDLRPRWRWDPPDARRFDRWWVVFQLSGPDLDETQAMAAVQALPQVLEVRPATRPSRSAAKRRGGVRPKPGREQHIDVECLVDGSDGRSVVRTDALLRTLSERPTRAPRVPRKLWWRMLRDRLMRRTSGVYTYWGGGTSVSADVIGPDVPDAETGPRLNAWASRDD